MDLSQERNLMDVVEAYSRGDVHLQAIYGSKLSLMTVACHALGLTKHPVEDWRLPIEAQVRVEEMTGIDTRTIDVWEDRNASFDWVADRLLAGAASQSSDHVSDCEDQPPCRRT